MVYDLFLYHLVDNDDELKNIYGDCKSGKRICGECKAMCAELMIDFLREHQKRREKARDIVDRILRS
jgi:tryptophanyl-tRNA synthetase